MEENYESKNLTIQTINEEPQKVLAPVDQYQFGDQISYDINFNKIIKQGLSEKGQGIIIKEYYLGPNFTQQQLKIFKKLVLYINTYCEKNHNKNLVKYYKAIFLPDKVQIITEKLPMTFEDIPFNHEKNLKVYLRQIIQAMQHLYRLGIQNINLKPSNILINSEGVLKIRDYLGQRFLDMIFENEVYENTSDIKKMECQKDTQNLIKLIRILVYEKDINIKNKEDLKQFMILIEEFFKKRFINFDVLLNHSFLKIQEDQLSLTLQNKNYVKSQTIPIKEHEFQKNYMVYQTDIFQNKKESNKQNNNEWSKEQSISQSFSNPGSDLSGGKKKQIEKELKQTIAKKELENDQLLDNIFDDFENSPFSEKENNSSDKNKSNSNSQNQKTESPHESEVKQRRLFKKNFQAKNLNNKQQYDNDYQISQKKVKFMNSNI